MEELTGSRVTENVYFCPDGKYRWIFEFSMLKNPVILLTIWKIFGIVIVILGVFSFLLALFEGDAGDWVTGFLLTPGVLIVPGIMFALSIIGYLVLAAMYGGKYMVLFEMDEEKVVHIQMPKQYKKAEAMGWLTAMAGLVTGNFTAAGTGMLAASKDRSVSEFAHVKKVVGSRGLHLIKVNQTMEHNQVYALDADYDFVWNFIVSHCPNAKIR